MDDKQKIMVEAAIELVKGWVRPLVFLGMTAVMCVMTLDGTLNDVSWQFWAVYGGVGSVWIGEGTLNKIVKIKSSK